MKWRSRARRALRVLIGREVRQGVQTVAAAELLGAGAGARAVHPGRLDERSVVYSYGVGRDLSFELALVERFGARVHAFDPTPRAVAWVRRQSLPDRIVFSELGGADFDGQATFQPPPRPDFVSYRMVASGRAPRREGCFEAPVERLATTMRRLGHRRIDLLKLDVEGAEYRILADMLATGVMVDQLLVEFHHRFAEVGAARTRRAIRELNRHGWLIFHIADGGDDCAFLRTADPVASG